MRTEFYAKKTGNWWLSNFYPAPIQWNGKEWPTSEHLYQALKTRNDSVMENIRLMPTPGLAKKEARRVGNDLSIQDKAALMRVAIYAKFTQHPDLASQLIATEGVIVEASPEDGLWGEGEEGLGLNLMGLLLMELREALKGNVRPLAPADNQTPTTQENV